MIREKINYVDYDGNDREEVCYFNLNSVEIIRLDAKYESFGGIEGVVKKISVKNPSKKMVLDFFEDLILAAYGVKSEDGRVLVKRKGGVNLSEEFSQTEAYNVLLTKVTNSTDSMSRFFNALVQQSDIEKARAAKAARERSLEEAPTNKA